MGSIYVICSRQCPNRDGIYTLLYALYKYSTSITNQPTKSWFVLSQSSSQGLTWAVSFLQNTHNRYPIAHPLGTDMGVSVVSSGSGSVFLLWLSKVSANERRCYICNIFSHWLGPCSDTESKLVLVWGLLSQFPPVHYFLIFSALSKHTIDIEYHLNIWQVPPQLSCGDTCQIWMWFKESKRYFCKIENFAYGEINEQSFSNPHPRSVLNLYTMFQTSVDCQPRSDKNWPWLITLPA